MRRLVVFSAVILVLAGGVTASDARVSLTSLRECPSHAMRVVAADAQAVVTKPKV
jgi:hypothetical protein